MPSIKDILDFFKQPSWLFLTLATIAGLILFVPSRYSNSLGFDYFRTTYKPWLGLTFVTTGIFGVVGVWRFVYGSFRKRSSGRAARAFVRQVLETLSSEERIIIAYCICRNTTTVAVEMTHPTAQSLSQKGLLQPSAGLVRWGLHPHVIPPTMWNFVKENADAVMQGQTCENFSDAFASYEAYVREKRGA